MLVVGGSYEGHIVGYALPPSVHEAGADGVDAPSPTFALSAHDGCVRAAAAGGAQLATSGTDNKIGVYNLRKLRAQGELLQEEVPLREELRQGALDRLLRGAALL